MTEILEKEVYRGIHYVRISELPVDQQSLFRNWLPKNQVIKIMINREVFEDCVQYHHYEHWHKNIYPAQEMAKMKVANGEQKNGIFKFSFLKAT